MKKLLIAAFVIISHYGICSGLDSLLNAYKNEFLSIDTTIKYAELTISYQMDLVSIGEYGRCERHQDYIINVSLDKRFTEKCFKHGHLNKIKSILFHELAHGLWLMDHSTRLDIMNPELYAKSGSFFDRNIDHLIQSLILRKESLLTRD